MGAALARALITGGHDVVIVSGPVEITYPKEAEVIRVQSTQQMLDACLREFPKCQGVIGAAAPCDYRPETVAEQKIKKSGGGLILKLVETPDILAALGQIKESRWMVGFALESTDFLQNAREKMRLKKCDMMVVNTPAAIHSEQTSVELLFAGDENKRSLSGSKLDVAVSICREIQERLINRRHQ